MTTNQYYYQPLPANSNILKCAGIVTEENKLFMVTEDTVITESYKGDKIKKSNHYKTETK